MTNYPVGRLWAAAPAGARFRAASLQSGILLATPFTLTENLALTALEIVPTSNSEQRGSVKVAIYNAINNVPSGAPLVAADIAVKPISRAIWQAPIVDGAPVPVALTAGSYFVATMLVGNLTLRAIDGESQEVESLLGRSLLSDPRPVTALTLAAEVTALPLTFTGAESWQDWRGPGAPVVYLAS